MKSINSSISVALAIFDFQEVISREFLGPADLTKAQTFCIHELTEVVVICKHKDFVLTAFKVVPPVLESLNNSPELAIMGLILSLSRNHIISHRNPDSIWQHLVS